MRQVSAKGRRFIQLREAYGGVPELRAYLDDAGVPTIGFGSTKGVRMGMVITEEDAERRLNDDLEEAERAVDRLVKVELSEDQFDALVSFVFNVGVGAFAKSTLLRVLNDRRYDHVDDQMMKWVFITVGGKKVKSTGLWNRRSMEATLWNESLSFRQVDAGADAPTSRTTPTPPPTKAGLLSTSTGRAQATALGAGTAGAVAEGVSNTGAGDALREHASSFGEMSQYLDFAKYLFIVLTIAAIGFTMWERWRKLREGE